MKLECWPQCVLFELVKLKHVSKTMSMSDTVCY